MPLPDPRPSEKIAKLFRQTEPPQDKPKVPADGARPNAAPTSTAQAAETVPLPQARPVIEPERKSRRRRLYRRHFP
jgi:membrane-bound lytic murein transglycosylase A